MNGALPIVAVAILLAGPLASAASADCGGSGRPACSILRPPPRPPAPPPPPLAPECVLLVGGLGSHVIDPEYRSFADLATAVPDGARVEAFAYDSYGPIADAALKLRDEARALATECAAVHVVAHSQGGVVADRAFSLGLSGADRVTTYVALSSPHNGAWAAMQLCGIGDVDDRFSDLLREITPRVGAPDVTSEAICDLAHVTPPRPPRSVAEVRLRLADDVVVLRSDWADRRFDARELLPFANELEGHGAILHDARAIAVVAAHVASGAPPSDDRAALERNAAAIVGTAADAVLRAGETLLADALFGVAYLARGATFTQDAFDRIASAASGLIARFPVPRRGADR